jgi:5-formyltetrahydrofolate cyclo-ligase
VAEAGAAVARRLEALPAIAGARRVAAYRAVRGEIPLDRLLDGERRDVFTVPRVVGDDLEFVARRDGQSFTPGSFGIPEPADGEVVALADHDAVLVPLTAFDGRGHRLGQGGGFYDRALASLPSGGPRPAAIGVAYSFQQVAEVPKDRWDVPLDAVATDAGIVIADGGLLA